MISAGCSVSETRRCLLEALASHKQPPPARAGDFPAVLWPVRTVHPTEGLPAYLSRGCPPMVGDRRTASLVI